MSTPEEIHSTAPALMDTTENYSGARPQPIMAEVTLQEWSAHDDDLAETVGSITFDAAPVLAGIVPGLSPYQLSDMSPEICDQIFYEAVSRELVPDHKGPFELDVQHALNAALEATPSYFDVPYPHHLVTRHPEVVLQSHLSPYEIGVRVDDNNFVSGLLAIDLDRFIENDVEGLNNLLGELLIGSETLLEPAATPVRVDGEGILVVRISGDATGIISWFDNEELDAYEAGLALNPSRGQADDSAGQS